MKQVQVMMSVMINARVMVNLADDTDEDSQNTVGVIIGSDRLSVAPVVLSFKDDGIEVPTDGQQEMAAQLALNATMNFVQEQVRIATERQYGLARITAPTTVPPTGGALA